MSNITRNLLARLYQALILGEATEVVVHDVLAEQRQIAAIWSVEDVQGERPDLSDDQAWNVLQVIRRRHDAGIGINWDVICYTAAALYPEPKSIAS